MPSIDNASNEMIDAVKVALCRVKLPEERQDYFKFTGIIRTDFDDLRQFPRRHARGKAILERNGAFYAIYTKDISRSGMGILHHEQLFPCEKVTVVLPNKTQLRLRVARCVRIQDSCFECGMKFLFDE